MVTVGQKLYLRPIGNAARRTNDIKEVSVSKVGRKYFEVSEMSYTRFSIEGMVSDNGQYISDWAAYTSMQEILDEQEAVELHGKIKRIMGMRARHSVETLREVYKLLNN